MLNRIPIPRLPNQHQGSKTRRTARACDECRSRKIKCDGDRPSKQAQERDRFESANREVDRYEGLLREISQEVDVSVARKIMKALPSLQGQESRGEASSASSTSLTSSVGSLDALDTLDEDVNRSKASIATGYLGKSSEVAWMQSLTLKARCHGDNEGVSKGSQHSQSRDDDSVASVDYHIESADYPGLEDENPYTLPAKAPAERLLRLYLDSVQPSLPVIRQALFVDQFDSLYSGDSIHPGRKWLAVLNLIFAISSKLCQVSGQNIHRRDNKYFSRAQKLIISESLVEDHEDLQQVQVETLAAFFLMTSSQINRAWKMIGTATRSAIALGLHLRATHNKLNASALEARHKLWWSIFILENLLSVMTGRASGLGNSFCSAPPPLVAENMEHFTDDRPEARLERPSENPPMKWTIYQQREPLEAQRASMKFMHATDELYFFCLTDLILISHTASTQVYSTDAVNQGWDQIQSRISFFNRTMEEWSSSLPDSVSFKAINAGETVSKSNTYQISLSLHYYSSRIVLNRPCLTRPRASGKSAINSYRSRAREESATTCLHSALAILSIFPDQPDPIWACYVLWWNVLHFLVQATTILLINISLENLAPKKQRSHIFTSGMDAGQVSGSSEAVDSETVHTAAKKALQWLSCLGKTDVSAHRAFEICKNCIRRIAPTSFDLDEFIPVSAESNVHYLAVPTDQFHQQNRCKDDVSYPQFAGTGDFGYDSSTVVGAQFLEQGATDDFDLPLQPSFGILGNEIDMLDYVPAPHETLDDVLLSLGGADSEAI
ncbi:hypothetical protein PENANT_c025G04749 [Penicillium antarcticum]|uniref:Xylanolytic transcriptional activator regulatory domain-containing protein n=1 Tax=Penicillium antarcticum TaxID=416450 RepID=A0A1V6PXY3_9EURO|nr:hypothetical protein PENANT_c025G04749 [Penicillium antarcticum]